MVKVISVNGKIPLVDGKAIKATEVTAPIESAYDVQSVDNGDGTQTIEIADSAGTITDGIIVKARDADGWATEVNLYCADGKIPTKLCVNGNQNNSFGEQNTFCKLEKVNLKTPVTDIGDYAFAWLASLSELNIDFPALTSIGAGAFVGCSALHKDVVLDFAETKLASNVFYYSGITSISAVAFAKVPNGICRNCASLKTAYFPAVSTVGQWTSRCFMNCTALETAEFGSIGHPVTGKSDDSPFLGCTQSTLTITAYVRGNFADALLANFRNGATNATINIKAAEDTTYNDTQFAAGETIITSTVEVSA